MDKKIFVVDKQKWADGGFAKPFKIAAAFLIIMVLQGLITIITDFVLYTQVTDIALVRPFIVQLIMMGAYGIVVVIAAAFWSINLNQELRCFVQMDGKLYMAQHSRNGAFYAFAGGVGAGALLDMSGHKRAGRVSRIGGTAVAALNLSRSISNMQSPLWIGKMIDEMNQENRGMLKITEISNPTILSETPEMLVIQTGNKKLKIYNVYQEELFLLLKGGAQYA